MLQVEAGINQEDLLEDLEDSLFLANLRGEYYTTTGYIINDTYMRRGPLPLPSRLLGKITAFISGERSLEEIQDAYENIKASNDFVRAVILSHNLYSEVWNYSTLEDTNVYSAYQREDNAKALFGISIVFLKDDYGYIQVLTPSLAATIASLLFPEDFPYSPWALMIPPIEEEMIDRGIKKSYALISDGKGLRELTKLSYKDTMKPIAKPDPNVKGESQRLFVVYKDL